jgi:dynein light chain roadblock-type
MIDKP